MGPDFGPRTRPHLFAFDDVLALMVVVQLREKFSLQHIRRVVAHLRSHGYERPLTELRFATQGTEIFFQHPDGSWEGDRRQGQVILWHVLALEPLRKKIRDATSAPRDRRVSGQVENRRRVVGSKTVFAGTRTPVKTLFPYFRRRYSTDQILGAFPHLSRADVSLARRAFKELGAA